MRKLLHGNAAFRRSVPRDERAFLTALASDGQSPDTLFVGCSDSRVVPEQLTGSSPGELFVVRNVANLVPILDARDSSVGAAIEYAVGHLHVAHVVVCGHYGCGGIKGVIDGLHGLRALPSLVEWLAPVERVVAEVRAHEAHDPDPADFWRRAVEENVEEQLVHLLTYPCVARAVDAGAIQLHGWVYDLHSLELSVYDPDSDAFRPARDLLRG